ncbi:MAG TPA: hypothetical protein VFF65_04525 [Phycisphaerales bacterium]|nr:hypothetical protein [Phycisphaerales bacterium]
MASPVPIFRSFHHTAQPVLLGEEKRALREAWQALAPLRLVSEAGAAQVNHWPSAKAAIAAAFGQVLPVDVVCGQAERGKCGLNLDLRADVEQLAAMVAEQRRARPGMRLEWYGAARRDEEPGATGDPAGMERAYALEEMRAELLAPHIDVVGADAYMRVNAATGVPAGVRAPMVGVGEQAVAVYNEGFKRWTAATYLMLRELRRVWGKPARVWTSDRTISDRDVGTAGDIGDRLPPWVVDSMLRYLAKCVRAGLAEGVTLFAGHSDKTPGARRGGAQEFDGRDEQVVKMAAAVARGVSE